MILVFDVGNTNIVLGVFDQDKLVTSWRIATNRKHTADDLGVLVKNLFYFRGLQMSDVEALVMSSVVPPLTPAIVEMCKRYFGKEPLVVGPGVKTGMPIRYENPREVGADRIVNAVSVASRYGVPAIIVDFGTATTFCAVSRSGEYLGGLSLLELGFPQKPYLKRQLNYPASSWQNPIR